MSTLPDELLPEYDVETVHATRIAASPRAVYPAARRLDLSGSRLVRILFRLRGLPASALDADGLTALGFRVLRDDPPHGFALGLVGRFWTPRGGLVEFEPAAFADLHIVGHAKAVWTVELLPSEEGWTTLRTVTRVKGMGDGARRRFRRYWRLVGPFSGLIRKRYLEGVRRNVADGCG